MTCGATYHRSKKQKCERTPTVFMTHLMLLLKTRERLFGKLSRRQEGIRERPGRKKTDQDLRRAPLSNPFSQGGNWYRKTVNRREGEWNFKPLGRKPLSDTTHTVIPDNGHVLRKSELAFKKNQPLAPSKFSSVPNLIVSIYG